MNLTDRISILDRLGTFIKSGLDDSLQPAIAKSVRENRWFTHEGIRKTLSTIANEYLNKNILTTWTAKYRIKDNSTKKIGIILSGDTPMLGFHDVICAFLCGHISLIKCSPRDEVLIPFLNDRLTEFDPDVRNFLIATDKLGGMDAVIKSSDSGSTASFREYFSKYPHIMRENLRSVGIITQADNANQLASFGRDIFDNFGLGPRSISKLYVPSGYNFNKFFEAIAEYGHVVNHNKYKNNFDYSYSIYLLGRDKFLTNNFLIIREDQSLVSRIACLHYEYYNDLENVASMVKELSECIQSVVSSHPLEGIAHTPPGTCQSPGIDDYLGGVDTMKFLTGLYD